MIYCCTSFGAGRSRSSLTYAICTIYCILYKVPLRDVVDLKSRGCRKLKRGKTAVPVIHMGSYDTYGYLMYVYTHVHVKYELRYFALDVKMWA